MFVSIIRLPFFVALSAPKLKPNRKKKAIIKGKKARTKLLILRRMRVIRGSFAPAD